MNGPRPRHGPPGPPWEAPYLLEAVATLSAAALLLFSIAGPARLPIWRLFLHLLRQFLILAGISVLIVLALRAAARLTGREPGAGGPSLPSAGHLLRIVLGLATVETAHLVLKVFLPVFRRQTFDPYLAALDRALLGGRSAVELLRPLWDHPWVLHAVDVLYSGIYFLVLWGSVLVFLVALRGRERLAFFGSFALFWQLGLVLYLAVLAWGPVFVDPAPFARALESMPLTASVQAQLVRETSAIVHGQYDLAIRFYGLAAFPSLHVGVVALFLLWSRRLGRPWPALYALFLAGMAFGSVVTGYHYAIDGAGGAALAVVAWAAGRATLPGPER